MLLKWFYYLAVQYVMSGCVPLLYHGSFDILTLIHGISWRAISSQRGERKKEMKATVQYWGSVASQAYWQQGCFLSEYKEPFQDQEKATPLLSFCCCLWKWRHLLWSLPRDLSSTLVSPIIHTSVCVVLWFSRSFTWLSAKYAIHRACFPINSSLFPLDHVESSDDVLTSFYFEMT